MGRNCKIKSDLDEKIFKSGYNIKSDPSFFQKNIELIVNENNFIPSSKVFLSIKSFVQTISVVYSLRKITGEKFNSQEFIKEVALGALNIFRQAPKLAVENFYNTFQNLFNNPDSQRIVFQWITSK